MEGLIIIIFIALIVIAIAAALLLFGILVMTAGNIITLVPFVPTPRPVLQKIVENIRVKRRQKIIDLGAGDGRVLIALEKEFRTPGVGYELSLLPWLLAQWHLWRGKYKSQVHLQNFFKVDITDADFIFLFLTDVVMKKVADKINNESRPGTVIVSYGCKVQGWKATKVIPEDERAGRRSALYFFQK